MLATVPYPFQKLLSTTNIVMCIFFFAAAAAATLNHWLEKSL